MAEQALGASRTASVPTARSWLRLQGLARGLGIGKPLALPAPGAFRILDVFAYNLYFTSFGLALVYLYVAALRVGGPSKLVPGVLVAGTLAVFPVTTYATLSALMPRAGGDYAYVGQVLHPSLGFLASWNWVAWLSYWVGFGAYSFSAVGLRGWMVAAALTMDRPSLLALAQELARPGVVFAVGTLAILAFGALAALGMGTFLWVQRWSFLLSVLAVGLTVSALAGAERSVFVARFDQAAALAGVQDAYTTVVSAATRTGPHGSALAVVPAAFLLLPWTIGSAFVAPEVRDVQRVQPIGMLAALGAVTAVTALLGHLLLRTVGPEFLMGLAAGAGERWGLPVRLYLHEVVSLLLRPWAVPAVGLGFLCLGWMYMAQNMIHNARIAMAWARDGLAPPRWGEVHPQLHTPWRAMGPVVLAGEASLAMVCFVPSVQLLSSILALSFSAMLACLSAVLLPVRRPDLLRGVAAWRLGRVPAVSVLGAGGLAVLAYVDARYLLDGRYGANNTESLVAVGAVLAAGVAYRSWAVRRWRSSP